MLFNSPEFLFLFLPLVLGVYYFLNLKFPQTYGQSFLVASSLFFYGWWNVYHLPLLLFSIVFNFGTGRLLSPENGLEKKTSRLSLLSAGVITNVGCLAVFKYFCAPGNVGTLSPLFHETSPLWIIPLAWSFITFQQIAFLIDAYRGQTCPATLMDHLLFVSFFPQLIAGPIVLNREIIPQLKKDKKNGALYNEMPRALVIVSIGLFKKVVIADTFGIWADQGFNTSQALSFIESWATSLSFTIQLYYDFSGYSDIAIGLGLFFGIRLPVNFNSPYQSSNIREFWRRWHMTLSRFLREYVYFWLGGSRKGSLRVCVNLFLTCLISGIWHGTGWLFLLWGACHGLALVIYYLWSKLNIRIWRGLAWFITFNFINAGWTVFRADNWSDVTRILGGMYRIPSGGHHLVSLKFVDTLSMWFHYPFYSLLPAQLYSPKVNEAALLFSLITLAITLKIANSNMFRRCEISFRAIIYASLAFGASVVIPQITSSRVFLYFAF